MGHADLGPPSAVHFELAIWPLSEEIVHTAPLMGFLPVQRHPPASPVYLSLPHSAPSPLELSQPLRDLLLAGFRDLISCRGHSRVFTFRVFPTRDSRDHFWSDTLLILQDCDEQWRSSLSGFTQHLTMLFPHWSPNGEPFEFRT